MTGGWVALVDEGSGETYYFNEQTGASQWERPQGSADPTFDLALASPPPRAAAATTQLSQLLGLGASAPPPAPRAPRPPAAVSVALELDAVWFALLNGCSLYRSI